MCWATGIKTEAGRGKTSMGLPAESLFSGGCTPPFLNVFNILIYFAVLHSSFSSTLIFRGGKFSSIMAFVGQTGTHLRQSLHLSESINARLFSMVMASNLHSFSHFPHPIQATEQAFRATPPLSLFRHETTTLRFFGICLRNSIRSFGQASTQAPQATHLSSIILGTPRSARNSMASKSQESKQSPYPKQPH